MDVSFFSEIRNKLMVSWYFFRELEQKLFLRSTCLVNIFIWRVSLNQQLESLASARAAPNQKCADPLSGMPPTTLYLYLNRLRSIYQYSNMAPRLSGQTSIFGVVFFVSKSLLGIEGQKKLEEFAILTWNPRSHAWILIYRTWPIG